MLYKLPSGWMRPRSSNRFKYSVRKFRDGRCYNRNLCDGQVAQSVERSPEKAGVGGSIPSLATTF